MPPREAIFTSHSEIPDATLSSLDAIFVLGGGVPSSFADPPSYVKSRCDAAAQVYIRCSRLAKGGEEDQTPAILTLSAGTAHMPQLLSSDGLPVWESTASAAYILEQYSAKQIPPSKIFAETTSYDTISNAYFARTSFTDVFGWDRILVVTTEFHMARSKAIFDWIFGAKRGNDISGSKYELYYLSTPNVGLSKEALEVRRQHEARGKKTVLTKLSKQYTTLPAVLEFLTSNHDFFSASKLVERAATSAASNVFDPRSMALKLSYGGGGDGSNLNGGNGNSSAHLGVIVLAAVAMGVLVIKCCVPSTRASRHSRLYK
mmetsp:Transcript_13103/g.37352  ORF Transcript_13103/g.37352 Transcript_13103/m.37352 type:complete len:317 (+) Transcript_13103:64-1014(+)